MGTHPIFESDFDCLTEYQRNMGEKPPPVKNLSRNLRAMKFMRRGENHLDLEAEAVDLKTKPEQWFRDVEEIPVKSIGNEASLTDCLDLRWGRASFGGFNKTVERLAEKMNSKKESDD